MIEPLVSCIMPTFNRRAFVPYAIRYFLEQDYPNKELLIVDDGNDPVGDLIPDHEQIRYIRVPKRMTLGEKRNYCVLESKGELIMHWDDDDWMARYRISYQVKELLLRKAQICGLQEMFFFEIERGTSWLYKYPATGAPWLAGGSLLYTRDFWKKSPFAAVQVASDTQFIFARKLDSFIALADRNFYVASIHGNNTSPKNTKNGLWHSIPAESLSAIMGKDWLCYSTIHALSEHKELPNDKKKVAILITTRRPPGELEKIQKKLLEEKEKYQIEFFIADDNILKNGKKNYWKTINLLWNQIRHRDFQYYIQLPDDVLWNIPLIEKAIMSWENIIDDKKICLNLLLDGLRIGKTCWTNFWPEIKYFDSRRYLKTQWVDMIFISERKFFEELDWTIQAIPSSRWVNNPELSSGVGQQISNRLNQRSWNLYQVSETLLEHPDNVSIMNPEIRVREPIMTGELPLIYAGMASIPGREGQLKKAICSIVPYLDRLFLFLNEYSKIPSWLSDYENVTPFLGSSEGLNIGDSGKFVGLNFIKESDFFYFTLDDDLIYPPDYVWKMSRKIEQFHRKAIVGCGGYIMKSRVNHFYNDRERNWHISTQNDEDRPVQVLHTGISAWHSGTLMFRPSECKEPNMSDLWLALAAQKNQVPSILIQRPPNWVMIQPIPIEKTIFGRHRNSCKKQTDVYNSLHEWKLITV